MAKAENKPAPDIFTSISRWTDKIYPSREALAEKLAAGKKISVYLGVDPTSPHLHFGHAVSLLVLREFQKQGHKVTLLIGDFTARIGDPTDKLSPRQPLSAAEVKANMQTFRRQAAKIISFTGANAAKIVQNSKWLEKMTFADVVRLAQNVTVQQMIERDMFQERLRSAKPIGLHEFVYPIMQGYDSVALKTDLEIGGTDQTFNMLMGRNLVRTLQNREKLVITNKLLINPETGKKISKSEGGLINLDDTPEDVIGKVMSLSDVAMFELAKLGSDMPLDKIASLEREVHSGRMNPRDAKLEIAKYVAAMVHGQSVADKTAENFLRTFSGNSAPTNAPELKLPAHPISAADLVFSSGAVKSRSEAWRLVAQGGLEVGGTIIREPRREISPAPGTALRIGKKKFFRAAR